MNKSKKPISTILSRGRVTFGFRTSKILRNSYKAPRQVKPESLRTLEPTLGLQPTHVVERLKIFDNSSKRPQSWGGIENSALL